MKCDAPSCGATVSGLDLSQGETLCGSCRRAVAILCPFCGAALECLGMVGGDLASWWSCLDPICTGAAPFRSVDLGLIVLGRRMSRGFVLFLALSVGLLIWGLACR